jgi:hypothetical protein
MKTLEKPGVIEPMATSPTQGIEGLVSRTVLQATNVPSTIVPPLIRQSYVATIVPPLCVAVTSTQRHNSPSYITSSHACQSSN